MEFLEARCRPGVRVRAHVIYHNHHTLTRQNTPRNPITTRDPFRSDIAGGPTHTCHLTRVRCDRRGRAGDEDELAK